MLYLDYSWDLNPNSIILDKELDISELGWKEGDCFKIINNNGRFVLRKMEEVEQFSLGHKVNFGVENGCS